MSLFSNVSCETKVIYAHSLVAFASHYTRDRPYMIAVLSDENGSDLCAVCIVSGRTIQNIGAVFSCLEEMKERFDMALEEDGGDADSLLAGNSGQVSRDVASLVAKYNDPNVETIQKLKNQMKDVQASLSSAIAVLMLRGDKLNELLDNAEDLAKKAGDIEVVGRQLYCKMLWRYWKWVLMIVLGLLIFIGIVVAIACSAEKC